MSTEIKPGQVWAWQDTYDAKGPHGSLFEIIEAGTDVTYQYRDAAGFDPEQTRAASADLIRANANLVRCVCRSGTEDTCNEHSATPAPLDPSKVRAGDTVTLLVDPPDTHPAFTVAGETHSLGGPTVYLGGWRVDDLPDYVTLTDHQPAPEPEPEYRSQFVAVTDANGGVSYEGFIDTDGDFYGMEDGFLRLASLENYQNVRPLVVIDPAADWWAEIHNALVAAGIGDAGSAASIALRTLGIEATS